MFYFSQLHLYGQLKKYPLDGALEYTDPRVQVKSTQ